MEECPISDEEVLVDYGEFTEEEIKEMNEVMLQDINLLLYRSILLLLPSMIRVCPRIMVVMLRQHRRAWRVLR